MHTIINKESNILKNISKLMGGFFLAQLITIVTIPIVTRLYAPNELGILNFFVSLSTILSIIISISLPLSLPLLTVLKKEKSLFKIYVYISIFLTLLLCAITIVFGNNIIENFEIDGNLNLIFLSILGGFILSWISYFENLCYKNNQFSTQSLSHISQSIINNSFKIILSYFQNTALFLIIATLLGYFAKLIILGGFLYKKSFLKGYALNKLNYYDFLLLKKVKSFPIYRFPQILLNTIASHFPVFLLLYYFGPEYVAFYSLALFCLAFPISLVGNSISNALYPHLVDLKSKSNNLIKKQLKVFLFYLMLISTIPFLIVYYYSEQIFFLVFGKEWIEASKFFQVLIYHSYCMLLSRPFISAIPVLNLNKEFFIIEIFSVFIRIVPMWFVLSMNNNAINGIITYSILSALIYVFIIIFVYKKTEK